MKRIIVKNLNKKFVIGNKKNDNTLTRVIAFFLRSKECKDNKKTIQVADDISFEAGEGEIVGIIGCNGSGKSTLLRLISGIYQKDSGEITTNGKLIYLNGYGQGLQERLTMRENIYLMGSFMGLSKNEIEEKFDEIVEFSGLKEFIDVKVYKFSSGMVTRLNFSVTIHCVKHHNPEIFLLDEVFSGGGDMDFSEKSIKMVENFLKNGATVLIVSHDLGIIEKYCDKVIWLDQGKIVGSGTTDNIIAEYISFNK